MLVPYEGARDEKNASIQTLFAGILACLINVCSHCKRLAGDFLQVVNFKTKSLFCAISAVFAVLRISVL